MQITPFLLSFSIFSIAASAALTLATSPEAADESGFVAVDYAKLDRRILEEPTYVAEPRYALFILDPAGKFRAWAVLDKSKKDLPFDDVLYFDKNGNGKLTDAGERFLGTRQEMGDHYGFNYRIPVGDLRIPGTDLIHTELEFLPVVKSGEGRKGVYFSMKWAGKEPVGGGDTPGNDHTQWSRSPKEAPVLRPTPLGPLAFSLWLTPSLKIGGETKVNLMIGSPGSGPDTLCVLSENFLVPGKDRIKATLLAKDKHGKPLRILYEIKEHC